MHFVLVLYSSVFLDINQKNVIYGQIATNSSNPTITIPTTISKEAQNALKNIASQMPEFVTPEPNDLNGWAELNTQVSATSIAQS